MSDDDLKRAIEVELAGSSCFVGYRKMWDRLRNRGKYYTSECVFY